MKRDVYLKEGSAVIYLSVEDTLAGYLVLSDTIREESKDMIAALESVGVWPVLLTGDNPNAAEAIAGQLGIREVYAGCLPEDKLNQIGSYQKRGNAVCMIGDGINDAPRAEKSRRRDLPWAVWEAILRWMPRTLPLWRMRSVNSRIYCPSPNE